MKTHSWHPKPYVKKKGTRKREEKSKKEKLHTRSLLLYGMGITVKLRRVVLMAMRKMKIYSV